MHHRLGQGWITQITLRATSEKQYNLAGRIYKNLYLYITFGQTANIYWGENLKQNELLLLFSLFFMYTNIDNIIIIMQ